MSYPGSYGTHGQQQQHGDYPPPQQQYGNYPPPQQQYGNYPSPQQQYGNYPPPPQYGNYPPPSQQQQYGNYPPPSQQQQYGNYPPPPQQQQYGSYHPPPQQGEYQQPYGPDPVFQPTDPNMNQANYPSTHEQNPGKVPHGPIQDGSDYVMHVNPIMQNQSPPNFQLSNCQGRKRALLIGINYTGSANALNGCINDVKNVKEFLTNLYQFRAEDMVILTDDQSEEKFQPTKQNILSAMQWLVNGARENDSGHGGRVKDQDGDEDDGYDETIYPVDYDRYEGESGQIVDDEMHEIMVRPLPRGCRLTAIFDSCHSGTALDLPYVYSTQGVIKEDSILKDAGSGLLSAGMAYATGNKSGALSSIFNLGKNLMGRKGVDEKIKKFKSSEADVIMFSGCKDNQTSADAMENGKSTGAMSYAFTTVLRQNNQQTLLQLLNSVRDILKNKYSQRPQLSSSHPIDVNLLFII
ncbi:hypothetical protein G6F56_001940 [Rhizopus delemar]|nr:hypothetical protein G6F56_001940 [Rhizopus delemar]